MPLRWPANDLSHGMVIVDSNLTLIEGHFTGDELDEYASHQGGRLHTIDGTGQIVQVDAGDVRMLMRHFNIRKVRRRCALMMSQYDWDLIYHIFSHNNGDAYECSYPYCAKH